MSHVPLTFSLPFSLIFVAVVTLGQARAADDLTLGYTRNFKNPIPRPEPDRPAPEIDDIAPRVVLRGEGPVTLKVMGENFLSTAVVTLNGRPLPTRVALKADRFAENFERVREITATIDPKLTQNVGTYEVRVLHDGLGGAVSNPTPFIVKFK